MKNKFTDNFSVECLMRGESNRDFEITEPVALEDDGDAMIDDLIKEKPHLARPMTEAEITATLLKVFGKK